MTTWFTADSHFFHPNIVLHCKRMPWLYSNPTYNPDKPYHFKHNNPWAVDIKAHDEALIENWNERVGKKDRVYILGDFAYKNHRQYILSLNGNKILIKGNHDKMSHDCYNLFQEISEEDRIFREMQKECHSFLKQFKNGNIDMLSCSENLIKTLWAKFMGIESIEDIDQMTSQCYNLFEDVHEMGLRRRIDGVDITMCHYGMRTWASSIHGAYQIYGHSHGRLPEPKGMYSFDVGVDVWDYAPIPWEVVIEKMKRIKEGVTRVLDGEDLDDLSKFDQKIMETRRNNYVILQSMGIPIKYPEMVEKT